VAGLVSISSGNSFGPADPSFAAIWAACCGGLDVSAGPSPQTAAGAK
jgi:hypothetical protein